MKQNKNNKKEKIKGISFFSFANLIVSFLLIFLMASFVSASSENLFNSTWNTSAVSDGSSDANQITLPLVDDVSSSYDFVVDWGDGNTSIVTSWDSVNKTHTYASEGVYNITINGTLVGFSFNNEGDKLKLLEITQWGDLRLGNNGGYFYGTSNLDLSNVADVLNLSGTTDLNVAFRESGISTVNHINEWDVSGVTIMGSSGIPYGGIFRGSNFNDDISNWDVSKITSMYGMFRSTPFNQDISNWDVSNVESFKDFIYSAQLSTENYDKLLIKWAQLPLQSEVTFDGGDSQYNLGLPNESRQGMIDDPGWTITDGGDTGEEFNKFVFQIEIEEDGQNFTFSADNPDLTIDFSGGRGIINVQESGTDVLITSQYSKKGIYNVYLNGTANRISFYGDEEGTPTLLKDILSPVYPAVTGINSTHSMFRGATNITNFTSQDWFDETSGNVTTMAWMFYDSSNFNGSSVVDWNTSKVTSMGYMFQGASSFNQPIGNWDVSKVESMVAMLRDTSFNQPLNNWDVSKVKKMYRLFWGASSFNQNLSGWNTSGVTTMSSMFRGASSFNNGDVSLGSNIPLDWDVSKITSIGSLFMSAGSFNQPIGHWNTSKVTSMQRPFGSGFNQDIGNWDVSNVVTMGNDAGWGGTFANADSFNQDISDWNVSKVTNFGGFLKKYGSGTLSFSTENYDKLLIKWSELDLNENLDFHSDSSYSLGLPSEKRQHIIDAFSWNITDGGDTGEEYILEPIVVNPVDNGNYNSSSLVLNITTNNTHSIERIWYAWNGTETNYTSAEMIDFPEGEIELTVWVEDYLEETRNTTISFLVDTIYPEVEFGEGTLDNNSFVNATSIFVNVSSSDVNEQYSFVNWDNSLVGWWRFEEDSWNDVDGEVRDESGMENNGRAKGGANTGADGKFGRAGSFDGDGDYVDCGKSVGTEGADALTMSAWIKMDSLPTGGSSKYHITGRWGTTGEDYRVIAGRVSNSTRLALLTHNGSDPLSDSVTVDELSPDTWYLISWIYDGGNGAIYLNGEKQGNLTGLSTSLNSDASKSFYSIGMDSDSFGLFNGSIDDVLIFNRSLSEDEIKSLYNATAYQYENTFSDLDEGEYSTKGYVVDSAGNVNSTETRTITLDTIAPTAEALLPSDESYSNEEEVNFTLNVSDTNLKNATLKIFNASGLWGEFSQTIGGTSAIIYELVNGFTDGIYTWFWKVFDRAENFNITENKTLIVDLISPKIKFVSPTPGNNTGVTEGFTINASIEEDYLANVTYNWDGADYALDLNHSLKPLDELYEGLVLFMDFENRSEYGENDSLVYDYSGMENNGTVYGNSSYTEYGKYGKGIEFDGDGDYVEVGNDPLLNSDSLTISIWVKKRSLDFSTTNTFLAKAYVGTNSRWEQYSLYYTSDDRIGFKISNGSVNKNINSFEISDTSWHHILGTWDNLTKEFVLYIDGLNVDSEIIPDYFIQNTDYKLGIGAEAASPRSFFNGSIDDVMIYNRSLSEDEVKQIYSSQLSKFPDAPENNSINYTRNESFDSGNVNMTLSTNDVNVSQFYLDVVQGGLTLGQSYNFFMSTKDLAGNTNTTEILSVIANTQNIYNSVDFSPGLTSYDEIDPLKNVTVTTNITSNEDNFNSAILQWKNSTQNWSDVEGISEQNILMSLLDHSEGVSILQGNLTLPSYEGNITTRVWSNDTEGMVSNSSEYVLQSWWDCTWNVEPSELEEVLGHYEDKHIGNITLINTGDVEYNNSGEECNIEFDLSQSEWSETYLLLIGDSINWKTDNNRFQYKSPVTVNASNSTIVQVNASFPSAENPFTETPTISIDADINDTITGNSSASVDSTLIISSPQPLLYQSISGDSEETINLIPQEINIIAYTRNLGYDSDNPLNTTAHNVSINWSVPSSLSSEISGDRTNFFEILNNSNRQYLNLTLNLTEDNLKEMSRGTHDFVLSSLGYENDSGNFSLMVNSDNQTILTNNKTLEFVCGDESDSYSYDCGLERSSSGEDTRGGGGGGGSGGTATETLSTRADFQLVRGEDNEVEISIYNRDSNESLKDLSFEITGDIAKYIDIVPKSVDEIPPQEKFNLKLLITSPSYVQLGRSEITLNIKGKKGLSNYKETKKIVLEIHEISGTRAKELLEESEEWVRKLQEKGIGKESLEKLLNESKKEIDNFGYETIKKNYETISSEAETGLKAKEIMDELEELFKDAEEKGIDIRNSDRLWRLAELSMERRDFAQAYERIKDAQVTYALEVKGELGKMSYYLRNYPGEISLALILFFIFSFGTVKLTRLGLLKRKLKQLKEEQRILQELMEVTQKEAFKDKKMSMEEYQTAMEQYQNRLSQTVEGMIEVESKRAHELRFESKEKRLKHEKKRVFELIKQAQIDYLKEQTIETRAYELRMNSYNKRLVEVESALADIESSRVFKQTARQRKKDFIKSVFTGRVFKNIKNLLKEQDDFGDLE